MDDAVTLVGVIVYVAVPLETMRVVFELKLLPESVTDMLNTPDRGEMELMIGGGARAVVPRVNERKAL